MSLLTLAKKHKCTKLEHSHYIKLYETYLDAVPDEMTMLEIGIQDGGSIRMWHDFFPEATIYGIDKKLKVNFTSKRIVLIEGRQEDSGIYKQVPSGLSLVIDDGGHTMKQQQVAFEYCWPKLANGGLYVIEDLHTSYWPHFGGEINGEQTTVVFLCQLINAMNYAAIRSSRAENYRQRSIAFGGEVAWIHCYESICFIGKK